MCLNSDLKSDLKLINYRHKEAVATAVLKVLCKLSLVLIISSYDSFTRDLNFIENWNNALHIFIH